MPKTVSNNQGVFIELERDLENNWIYARWIGQVSPDDVQRGALCALEMIESSNCELFLNDNRELLGHWSEANEWIATVWIPRAMALGLRKFAHILSHYSYGQLSAEQMQHNVGTSFQMHLFQEPDKARAWLHKKD